MMRRLFSLVGLSALSSRSPRSLIELALLANSCRRGRTDVCEELEGRTLFAAFDIIGLTQLRADPVYSSIDGSGVTVAVLDTGLDGTHRDLSGNYLAGFDAVNGESTPVDRQGHGTHVAGLVGSTNRSIGVAPEAGLVGVKVLGDDGSGRNSDIAEGLRWVFDNRQTYNIVAVNMSLGGGFYRSESEASGDPVIAEINRLERVGVTVISAAGNSFKGREYQNFAAPAIGSTLGVGAVWEDTFNSSIEWGSGATDFTTGEDRITSFSQRLVANNTIFAPGALLRSTAPRNSYAEMGGTSQASPVVAGAVALLQDAARTFAGRLLTPEEVVTTIRATADTIFDGDDENDNVQNTQVSYPRLNIYRAVQRVREQFGNVPPPPPPPGGGETVPDPNGRLSGAIGITPDLDGNEVLSITGRIGVDGDSDAIGGRDVDMFKVSVASRGNVTLSLTPDESDRADFDSYLRLFASDGTEISSDDDGGDFGYSRLTANLQPGTYFIGVSGAPNIAYDPSLAGGVVGATGSYTLSLSLSNSDPNGLLSGAVEVRLGTDAVPLEFAGFIGADLGQPVGTSDVDLFRVSVPDNGLLIVDIDTPDAEGFVDSFLRVFDANGAALGFNDDTLADGSEFSNPSFPGFAFDRDGNFIGHDTDSYLAINVERGGVYYFGVSDFQNQDYAPSNLDNRRPNGPGGTYTIIVRHVTPDINGTIESVRTETVTLPYNALPGRIGLDADPSSGQTFEVGDKDVDFFRIFSTRAGVLEADINSFSLAGNAAPFDTVLTLFDANGRTLATVDDSTGSLDAFMQYTILANTNYYLAVSGYGNGNFDPLASGSGSSGETGSYQISARILSSSVTKNITDDALSHRAVQNLAVGSTVNGEIGTDGGFASGAADVDLYRFKPTSNGVLTVTTSVFEAFEADTVVRVFDSKGVEIAFNDNISEDTRASTVTLAVQRGKTYFIGISGSSDNPRAYNPSRTGTALAGSTGAYQFNTTFNLPPTLTVVSQLSLADQGLPFEVTYDMLAAAGNEADAEGAPISFVVGAVLSGTLTQGGVAVGAGATISPTSGTLVWTSLANATKPTKAFTLFANDGSQSSAKAVTVTIAVNAAPTLTRVNALSLRIDPLAPPASIDVPFASLLSAANEADANRDVIRFVIDSVFDGTLTINGEAVTPGETLFSAGQTLTWTPSVAPSITNLNINIFSVRAFDGRLFSPAAITVAGKFRR